MPTPITSDDAQHLRELSVRIRDGQESVDTLREQRQSLVRRLHEDGVSRYELARACGLSPQRTSKVIDGNAPPRRSRSKVA